MLIIRDVRGFVKHFSGNNKGLSFARQMERGGAVDS
jgi:hypothetical protein